MAVWDTGHMPYFMVSVVQSGITYVKVNVDIGTILKVLPPPPPPALQIGAKSGDSWLPAGTLAAIEEKGRA
jgi:hypothetical protein